MSRRRRKQTAAERKQALAIEPAHSRMGLTRLVTIVLLLFVVGSVAYAIAGGLQTQARSTDDDSQVTVSPGAESIPNRRVGAEKPERRVIAYYFHGEYRCRTCRAIEQYAREALVVGFPEALQSGTLEWRAVNVEDPEHRHFVDDYQLRAKSLILVEMDGETQIRWKNLDRIWALVGNKSAFISYVQEGTRAYLEGD